MTIFYLGILILAAVSSSQSFITEPWTAFEFGQLDKPPPDCRDLTLSEMKERGEAEPGKSATFILKPESRCEYDIFLDSERDPFYRFVVDHAPAKARELAHQLKARIDETNGTEQMPWSLSVRADDPRAQKYLLDLFLAELSQKLGPGAITRGRTAQRSRHIIVNVQRIIDPENFLQISSTIPAPGEG